MNLEVHKRACRVLPSLLFCVPVSAQFTDESAQQRDRKRVEALIGQPDTGTRDGKISQAEYSPDFPDHETGREIRTTVSASTISKGRLAHNPPKAARREFDRGMQARRKDRLSEALQHFAQAVSLDPIYLQALAELGELYLRQGNAIEALKYLEQARLLDDSLSFLHVNIAMSLLKLNRPVEAESAARRAVHLDPTSEAAHLELGLALLYQNRVEPEAAEHLEIAARRYPDVRSWVAWVGERLSSSAAQR